MMIIIYYRQEAILVSHVLLNLNSDKKWPEIVNGLFLFCSGMIVFLRNLSMKVSTMKVKLVYNPGNIKKILVVPTMGLEYM